MDENSNIIYLSGNNIKENIIDLDNVRYCSEKLHNKNLRSSVKKGSVLMSIVGTVGKASVVNLEIKANTDRNVATIKNIDDTINPYYLSVFLNSKFGKYQTKRFSTGNVQPLLNLLQVKSIIIPIISKTFQDKIAEELYNAHKCIDESKELYRLAENMLLEELGLKDWKPEEELVNIKSFNDFQKSGRLDAEYYQSKYDEIENKIKNYRGGYDVVRNCFIQNSNASNFNKEMYKYIEIGDINISDSSFEYNVVETKDLPANAKIEIEKNNIIISKVRPYRGAISIINSEEKDIIASGAFTALKESGNFSKETLLILLRTDIYKNWLLKWNVGSSYPVIKDEDILNLIIPKISKQIQTQISSKIQESFRLRKESERLLELAKIAVEMAIEEGEKKALNFISTQEPNYLGGGNNTQSL